MSNSVMFSFPRTVFLLLVLTLAGLAWWLLPSPTRLAGSPELDLVSEGVLHENVLYLSTRTTSAGSEVYAFDLATGNWTLAADAVPSEETMPRGLTRWQDRLFFTSLYPDAHAIYAFTPDSARTHDVQTVSDAALVKHPRLLGGHGRRLLASSLAEDTYTLLALGAELLQVDNSSMYLRVEDDAFEPVATLDLGLFSRDEPDALAWHEGRLFLEANGGLAAVDLDAGLENAPVEVVAPLEHIGVDGMHLRTFASTPHGLFFTTAGRTNASTLYRYTAEAGVEPVLELSPAGAIALHELTWLDGQLFVTADEADGESEPNRVLYALDPATGGLHLIHAGNPGQLLSAGLGLYFVADAPLLGRQVYVYEGSTARRLTRGRWSTDGPKLLDEVGAYVYFSAGGRLHRAER
ncbi:MAG: hypothetical protein AAGI08_06820 [Bacteroidota bacterium]